MKFTRCAILGLSLIGLFSGCSETETTVSVNVRFWTNYLDPTSFEVKLEQDGRSPIQEAIVPRDLGEGKFDVVCDHNWELEYCRYYKRIALNGWSEGDVTVTFSGETKGGLDIAADVAERGITDKLSETFELKTNAVNVVYFQLANVKAPADPVSPDVTSDSSGSTADAGTRDGGAVNPGVVDAGSSPRDGGTPDAGSPDAGASEAGALDASASGVVDAGMSVPFDAGDADSPDAFTTQTDAGVSGGATTDSGADAALDAGDASN
jgi:hypothetical protein